MMSKVVSPRESRAYLLQVRLTAEENQALESAAAAAVMSKSDYVRRAVFGAVRADYVRRVRGSDSDS